MYPARAGVCKHLNNYYRIARNIGRNETRTRWLGPKSLLREYWFFCAIANYHREKERERERERERWASKEGSSASLMMRWNCLLAGFHPIWGGGGGSFHPLKF